MTEFTDLRPEQPKNIEELGISERIVDNLIIKHIRQFGYLSVEELAGELKLAQNIIQTRCKALKDLKHIHAPVPLKYDLTEIGKQLAKEAVDEDAYLGPAPVSYEKYVEIVNEQASDDDRVTLEDVRRAFKGYVVPDDQLKRFMEGFNSAKPILLYGPPGNGKSLVTHSFHNLITGSILIPYSFEFNGRAIRVFDKHYHEPVVNSDDDKKPNADDPSSFLKRRKDERWTQCRPPLVVVGTEFRVTDFEVSYDGAYEAPPQIKANNGIFVLDDLGRQLDDHKIILNAFIYPLEFEKCILRMPGGTRLMLPYKQRLCLSTNLRKEDIIDDAFNRRLLYQYLVAAPVGETLKKIFLNEFKKRIPADETAVSAAVDKVLSWYAEENRVSRACDARNLMVLYESTFEPGEEVVLEEERLKRCLKLYPKPRAEVAEMWQED